MSYAGTNRGGTNAILAAERLVASDRSAAEVVDEHSVRVAFPEIVDRIMGEAALWDEQLAARAFVQARGDTAEAVHLLRAHRSTLPRFAISVPVDVDEIVLQRRIVSAHRSPDGPQLLGPTVDYSARLIREAGAADPLALDDDTEPAGGHADATPRRFSQYLAERDMLLDRTVPTDDEPFDLALHPVRLPAPRSAVLSAMAVAETGALVNLWYRSVLGPDGYSDESVTLGEVRHGAVPLRVMHPLTGNPVAIGAIRVTECESIDHMDERGEDPGKFDVGYGLALGHNERKAISMANMDIAAHRYHGTDVGDELQQLIMLTTDGLAANGFLEHLKLPHYVTFRSQMERAEAARSESQSAAAEKAPEEVAS